MCNFNKLLFMPYFISMSVFHMKATAKYLLNRSFSNKAQLHLSRHGKRDLCSLEIWPEKHLKDPVSSIFFFFFLFFWFYEYFYSGCLRWVILKIMPLFSGNRPYVFKRYAYKKIFVYKKKVYLIIFDFCLS